MGCSSSSTIQPDPDALPTHQNPSGHGSTSPLTSSSEEAIAEIRVYGHGEDSECEQPDPGDAPRDDSFSRRISLLHGRDFDEDEDRHGGESGKTAPPIIVPPLLPSPEEMLVLLTGMHALRGLRFHIAHAGSDELYEIHLDDLALLLIQAQISMFPASAVGKQAPARFGTNIATPNSTALPSSSTHPPHLSLESSQPSNSPSLSTTTTLDMYSSSAPDASPVLRPSGSPSGSPYASAPLLMRIQEDPRLALHRQSLVDVMRGSQGFQALASTLTQINQSMKDTRQRYDTIREQQDERVLSQLNTEGRPHDQAETKADIGTVSNDPNAPISNDIAQSPIRRPSTSVRPPTPRRSQTNPQSATSGRPSTPTSSNSMASSSSASSLTVSLPTPNVPTDSSASSPTNGLTALPPVSLTQPPSPVTSDTSVPPHHASTENSSSSFISIVTPDPSDPSVSPGPSSASPTTLVCTCAMLSPPRPPALTASHPAGDDHDTAPHLSRDLSVGSDALAPLTPMPGRSSLTSQTHTNTSSVPSASSSLLSPSQLDLRTSSYTGSSVGSSIPSGLSSSSSLSPSPLLARESSSLINASEGPTSRHVVSRVQCPLHPTHSSMMLTGKPSPLGFEDNQSYPGSSLSIPRRVRSKRVSDKETHTRTGDPLSTPVVGYSSEDGLTPVMVTSVNTMTGKPFDTPFGVNPVPREKRTTSQSDTPGVPISFQAGPLDTPSLPLGLIGSTTQKFPASAEVAPRSLPRDHHIKHSLATVGETTTDNHHLILITAPSSSTSLPPEPLRTASMPLPRKDPFVSQLKDVPRDQSKDQREMEAIPNTKSEQTVTIRNIKPSSGSGGHDNNQGNTTRTDIKDNTSEKGVVGMSVAATTQPDELDGHLRVSSTSAMSENVQGSTTGSNHGAASSSSSASNSSNSTSSSSGSGSLVSKLSHIKSDSEPTTLRQLHSRTTSPDAHTPTYPTPLSQLTGFLPRHSDAPSASPLLADSPLPGRVGRLTLNTEVSFDDGSGSPPSDEKGIDETMTSHSHDTKAVKDARRSQEVSAIVSSLRSKDMSSIGKSMNIIVNTSGSPVSPHTAPSGSPRALPPRPPSESPSSQRTRQIHQSPRSTNQLLSALWKSPTPPSPRSAALKQGVEDSTSSGTQTSTPSPRVRGRTLLSYSGEGFDQAPRGSVLHLIEQQQSALLQSRELMPLRRPSPSTATGSTSHPRDSPSLSSTTDHRGVINSPSIGQSPRIASRMVMPSQYSPMLQPIRTSIATRQGNLLSPSGSLTSASTSTTNTSQETLARSRPSPTIYVSEEIDPSRIARPPSGTLYRDDAAPAATSRSHTRSSSLSQALPSERRSFITTMLNAARTSESALRRRGDLNGSQPSSSSPDTTNPANSTNEVESPEAALNQQRYEAQTALLVIAVAFSETLPFNLEQSLLQYGQLTQDELSLCYLESIRHNSLLAYSSIAMMRLVIQFDPLEHAALPLLLAFRSLALSAPFPRTNYILEDGEIDDDPEGQARECAFLYKTGYVGDLGLATALMLISTLSPQRNPHRNIGRQVPAFPTKDASLTAGVHAMEDADTDDETDLDGTDGDESDTHPNPINQGGALVAKVKTGDGIDITTLDAGLASLSKFIGGVEDGLTLQLTNSRVMIGASRNNTNTTTQSQTQTQQQQDQRQQYPQGGGGGGESEGTTQTNPSPMNSTSSPTTSSSSAASSSSSSSPSSDGQTDTSNDLHPPPTLTSTAPSTTSSLRASGKTKTKKGRGRRRVAQFAAASEDGRGHDNHHHHTEKHLDKADRPMFSPHTAPTVPSTYWGKFVKFNVRTEVFTYDPYYRWKDVTETDEDDIFA